MWWLRCLVFLSFASCHPAPVQHAPKVSQERSTAAPTMQGSRCEEVGCPTGLTCVRYWLKDVGRPIFRMASCEIVCSIDDECPAEQVCSIGLVDFDDDTGLICRMSFPAILSAIERVERQLGPARSEPEIAFEIAKRLTTGTDLPVEPRLAWSHYRKACIGGLNRACQAANLNEDGAPFSK